MSSEALILTHPHPDYDHGAIEDALDSYIKDFEGDVIAIAEFGEEDVEQIYGSERSYDAIIEDETGGFIPEELSDTLASKYETIELGGGYVRECLRNTYECLKAAGDELDISINPELSYAQGTETFSLEEFRRKATDQQLDDFTDSIGGDQDYIRQRAGC